MYLASNAKCADKISLRSRLFSSVCTIYSGYSHTCAVRTCTCVQPLALTLTSLRISSLGSVIKCINVPFLVAEYYDKFTYS